MTGSGQFVCASRTEEGRATPVRELMQDIAAQDEHDSQVGFRTAMDYSRKSNLQDSWREFTKDISQPLFDFLSERVGAESSILHTLQRYRTCIEWFDREELYVRYTADTRNGEEIYNLDLQRFLFLEGDHITHAKPRSASGEADLIGDLDGREPLICDGKIFDGDGRGKSYLIKGLHQIIKYAHDYGSTPLTSSSTTSPTSSSTFPPTAFPAPGRRTPNWPVFGCISSTSASCRRPPPPVRPARPPACDSRRRVASLGLRESP
ncbi:hypothetical protein AB0K16_58895 [Nonomuraea jabiensis]|uniref:hypothetical protein n=1 Tax=Nonomuraea jabiensis TaxID=882448 RepID=UPI00341F0094